MFGQLGAGPSGLACAIQCQKNNKPFLLIEENDRVGEYDLYASKDVKKVNFLTRLIKSINYLIWGDV